jgi:hypothetical protein
MKKKKVLHLLPYDKFIPPETGGELFCYHLYKQLANFFDVTVIALQDPKTVDDKKFKNISVLNANPPINFSGLKNGIKYRWYIKSFFGPAIQCVLLYFPLIKKLSKTEHFDYVILRHLPILRLGRVVKKMFPHTVRILNHHNVDHLLYKKAFNLTVKKHTKKGAQLIRQEQKIDKNADYFLACSVHDKLFLERFNKNRIRGILVSNATVKKEIDIFEKVFSLPNLIFCGTLSFAPNNNGFIIRSGQ